MGGSKSMLCAVSVALIAAAAFAAPAARAATFFEATASLSLTLVSKGSANVSANTTFAGSDASASGNGGTVASVSGGDDLFSTSGDPLVQGDPLPEGATLLLEAGASGETAAVVTMLNTSSAFYEWDAAFTIVEVGGAAGTVEFSGLYSLSTVATLGNPALESAFAEARIAAGPVDVASDTLLGGDPKVDIPFSFSVNLAPGETKTVGIDMFVSGVGTSAPVPVPLPAAAPLLSVAFAALVLFRRRHC